MTEAMPIDTSDRPPTSGTTDHRVQQPAAAARSPVTTAFHSVLYESAADRPVAEAHEAPDFFVDLNLDQIVAGITRDKADYDLTPFFQAPLATVDAIRYRQEVLADLERPDISASIMNSARRFRAMRQHLEQAQKLHYAQQKQRWFIDAVAIYCDAVERLIEELAALDLGARALVALRAYLGACAATADFKALKAETVAIKAGLAEIEYSVLAKDGGFVVRKYADEPDYSIAVLETFAKFKQGSVKNYGVKFREPADMNHIEAKVLEFVARLY
ncbi:MAG: hypothetical protein ACREFD_09155, partial [Stellaceae bacterium]